MLLLSALPNRIVADVRIDSGRAITFVADLDLNEPAIHAVLGKM